MKEAHIRYLCACILILSSIFIAIHETLYMHDISEGILWYIAQAFLLAGSIFGLSAYVSKITKIITKNGQENVCH